MANIGNACFDCQCLYYETPKIARIQNRCIGVTSFMIKLGLWCYIIGYVIIVNKGYQEFSHIESSIITKMKGVAFTNFSDDEFNFYVKDRDIYRRVWDVADYVVPPTENGAVFVATNIEITSNQTLTVCLESSRVSGSECVPENNSCAAGEILPQGNGVMTGRCIRFGSNTYLCEIKAWCPLEMHMDVLKNESAVLSASQNFTLLIKNFIHFPLFEKSSRRNMKNEYNDLYRSKCRYNRETNPYCPIFRLGDVVEMAGQDYNKMAYKGGVIAITIDWRCDLDYSIELCLPTYSFSRLDDPKMILARGFNFRYADYYSDMSRTLYKLYGIKFIIVCQGRAGKFNLIPLLLNLGAGCALLALEIWICDCVLLCIVDNRNYFRSKKYEIVAESST